MARSTVQWMMLSMVVVLAAGMLLVLWAVWPLLPGRLPMDVAVSIDVEAAFAMIMLLVVVAGFGKLMMGR